MTDCNSDNMVAFANKFASDVKTLCDAHAKSTVQIMECLKAITGSKRTRAVKNVAKAKNVRANNMFNGRTKPPLQVVGVINPNKFCFRSPIKSHELMYDVKTYFEYKEKSTRSTKSMNVNVKVGELPFATFNKLVVSKTKPDAGTPNLATLVALTKLQESGSDDPVSNVVTYINGTNHVSTSFIKSYCILNSKSGIDSLDRSTIVKQIIWSEEDVQCMGSKKLTVDEIWKHFSELDTNGDESGDENISDSDAEDRSPEVENF